MIAYDPCNPIGMYPQSGPLGQVFVHEDFKYYRILQHYVTCVGERYIVQTTLFACGADNLDHDPYEALTIVWTDGVAESSGLVRGWQWEPSARSVMEAHWRSVATYRKEAHE